jgi:cytochrome c oxidase subunit 2
MKRSASWCAWLWAAVLVGCSGTQSPLNPAGEQARGLLSLLQLMTWVCGAMYLLVLGFLAWSLWRVRRWRSTSDDPHVDPADRGLSRGLLGWGALIVTGVTLLAVGSFVADRGLAKARDRDALDIKVTAHQWWWRIEYRDPSTGGWIETANEMHLPAGRTARITLGSADVIHSFWVPNVAGKMDVVPGRSNVIDVTPHRVGWFRGQCAEFCGVQHAHMAFDVKVESAEDFAAWLAAEAAPAGAPTDPTLMRGMKVVTEGQCAMCHVIRGTAATGRPGPDLTHTGSHRSIAAGTLSMSRGALQGWIAQPQALKPGTMMPSVALEPADADAVSSYLESLK